MNLSLMTGGSFYTNSLTELLVDPAVPNPTPQSQSKLQVELKRCEGLVQKDFRYAHLVAGASKMPMASIWVARNQEETVNDTDLAAFRDLAWTEFVKKRFLSSVAPDTSVAAAATSMLEIVRDMNLQRRRFHIMGLHEQVEASELQLVMHLCQANLLRGYGNDFKRAALRMRRSDRLFEAFSQAVGAFVCASAPMTLGAGTGRYERDLQYEYKKQMVGLLVYALQQNPRAVDSEDGSDEDYVARISRLIVVWQGRAGDGEQMVGETRDDGEDKDGSKEAVKQHLIGLSSAIALAQHDAQEAKDGAKRVELQVKEFRKVREAEMQNGRTEVLAECGRLASEVDAKVFRQDALLASGISNMTADIEVHKTLHSAEMEKLKAEWMDHSSQLQLNVYDMIKGFFTVGTDGQQTSAQVMVEAAMLGHLAKINSEVPVVVKNLVDAMQLENKVDIRILARIAGLDAEIQRKAGEALGQTGLDRRISDTVTSHLVSDTMVALINGHLTQVVGNRIKNIEDVQTRVNENIFEKLQNMENSFGTLEESFQDGSNENAIIVKSVEAIETSLRAYDTVCKQLQEQIDAEKTRRTLAEGSLDTARGELNTLGNKFKAMERMKGATDATLNTILTRLSGIDQAIGSANDTAVTDQKIQALRAEFVGQVAAIDNRVDALDTKPLMMTPALQNEILAFMKLVMDTLIAQTAAATTVSALPTNFFNQFATAAPPDMDYGPGGAAGRR